MQQSINILPIIIGIISIISLYILYSPSRSSNNIEADDTIVRSVVFFRHGDRGPYFSYPNDPHPLTDKSKWPHGSDSLTKKGKQDAYALGKILRQRYKNFLPDTYSSNDIITYSTNTERTYATAALVLASLYPPTRDELWSEQLAWHPIPIYSDIIFNLTNGYNCPRYAAEVNNVYKVYNESISKKYEELFAYMSKHSGLNVFQDPFIYTLLIGDTFIMQERNGLELPEWSKEIYPHEITPILNEIMNILILGSDVQRNLGKYIIMERIFELFRVGKRKMYIHSTHDFIITLFLASFDLPLPIKNPQTTATVIVELHSISGNDVIKAFMLENGRAKYFEPIMLNCGQYQCLLEEFVNAVMNITPDEYNAICNNVTSGTQIVHKLVHTIKTINNVPSI